MTPKLATLLHKLGDSAYEEMLRYYCAPKTEGICLETVRCLRAVLRHFGFAASPVSLFVYIHNPVTTRILLENPDLPSAEIMRLMEASWENGGWSVGTAAHRDSDPATLPERGYNAHLVLRCQDVLIDGSIAQYSGPRHGNVPPTFFQRGQFVKEITNDCLIVLEYAGDQSFRRMPGWSKQGGVNSKAAHDRVERRIVNAIIARVKAKYAA
jgi:hypothetical protein